MKKNTIINIFLNNWKSLLIIPIIFVILLSFLVYLTNFSQYNGIALDWKSLIIISVVLIILYVLVPFSTKTGIWSLVWALILSGITIILIVLLLIVESLRLAHPIFFIYLIPFLVMLFGSICWALKYWY